MSCIEHSQKYLMLVCLRFKTLSHFLFHGGLKGVYLGAILTKPYTSFLEICFIVPITWHDRNATYTTTATNERMLRIQPLQQMNECYVYNHCNKWTNATQLLQQMNECYTTTATNERMPHNYCNKWTNATYTTTATNERMLHNYCN